MAEMETVRDEMGSENKMEIVTDELGSENKFEIVGDELGSENKLEIVRDEMGSENNGVKSVKSRHLVTEIKYDDIPAWILTEVLITMPLKLVFRSKLVSKHWLSIISHPSFALTYTLRASKLSSLQPWTLIYGTMYVEGSQGWDFSRHQLLGDIYSRNIVQPSLHVLRCPSAQNLDEKSYKILGVSNGLVLYGLCSKGDWVDSIANYSICSPITKQWITLPPHGHRLKIVSNGFVTRVENGILTSYRVVRFDMFFRKNNVVTFEVFVSEIGEWKEFDVYIDQEIQFVWQGSHISLNEILHWITRKHGIMAYDPYHSPQSSRIIALPGDVLSRTCDTTHIDVFQGQLRYFKISDAFQSNYYYSHGFSSISVWVLNDYSSGDWSLQHRINSSDILYDSILQSRGLSLRPISFHPFDGDIMYFGYKNIIVSYNLKTREMEAHSSPIIDNSIWPCWSSTFLFVVPPWPVNVNIPQPFSRIMEDN